MTPSTTRRTAGGTVLPDSWRSDMKGRLIVDSVAAVARRTTRQAGRFLVAVSVLASLGTDAAPTADWHARVTPRLLAVWKGAQAPTPSADPPSGAPAGTKS